MVSEVTDRIQELLADFTVPFVVLDDDFETAPHDSVLIDQQYGARAMMRHLIDNRGARRVIFVGGLETNVDTIARFEAYRNVLEEAGIPRDDADAFFLDYEYESAYQLAREHVRDWAGAGNCVVAANDEMAAGIIAAAAKTGVSVSDELGVVGFDDTRVARMTRPPLTTVRVPMSEMGARAIELLCQRVADPTRATSRISLQPELIVRESCGSAK